MKTFVKTALATGIMLAATTQQAAAEICFTLFGKRYCIGGSSGGGDGGGGGGSVPAAPEIDVTQGVAAVAILMVATLIIRELYLRQRAGA